MVCVDCKLNLVKNSSLVTTTGYDIKYLNKQYTNTLNLHIQHMVASTWLGGHLRKPSAPESKVKS